MKLFKLKIELKIKLFGFLRVFLEPDILECELQKLDSKLEKLDSKLEKLDSELEFRAYNGHFYCKSIIVMSERSEFFLLPETWQVKNLARNVHFSALKSDTQPK